MMNEIQSASEIAKLLSDPLRFSMMHFLTWGACSVASLVAATAASQSNVSNHLKLLREGGLVIAGKEGRQTFYRLASPHIAEIIAALSWAACESGVPDTVAMPDALREARTCHDHLAGRAGVSLMEGLTREGAISTSCGPWETIELAAASNEVFDRLDFNLNKAINEGTRRRFAFACPDWSENHSSHLGGLLGAAICSHCMARGWIEKDEHSRAIVITAEGETSLDWLLRPYK